MPSIGNPYQTSTILPKQYAVCSIKTAWDGSWRPVPWLFPSECIDAAAPEIGSASLYYRFGEIARQGSTSFASSGGLNLLDYYVRIQLVNERSLPQTVWTGIITDDQVAPDRGDKISGVQRLKAYTLAHLLDRDPIDTAKFYDSNTGNLGDIAWSPIFNDRGKYGRKVLGNRSDTPFEEGIYKFGTDGKVWNNLQIAKYLLEFYSPEAFKVKLTGQSNLLSEIELVHDFEGLTFWECMNRLIDRRRGMGFVPVVKDQELQLKVFSVVDRPTKVKRKTMLANPNAVYLQLPQTYPYNHLIKELQFRHTAANRVDVLEVRGPRIKAMGTFSHADQTLEKGWTTALENEYKNAEGGSDYAVNDRLRSRDRYKGVFTRYRVPKDWDGRCGDGRGGGKNTLLLKAQKDGTLTTKERSSFYPQNKEFFRELPIEVGEDPNADTDVNPSNSEPEFIPLLASYSDDIGGTLHTGTGKWLILERADEADDQLRAVTVRPLDREMGVELHCSPRHYMAVSDWPSSTPAAKVQPELDWRKVAITAMIELDERMRILIESEGSDKLDSLRKVSIDVPEAHCWYKATDSIYDIGEAGVALRITPSDPEDPSAFQEKRSSSLEQVAAYALAWYSKFRQAVQIPIDQMGVFVPIGSLLTEINGRYIKERIHTPVTAVRIDFTNQTTVVECGWSAMDMVAGANVRSIKRSNRRGRV